MPHAPATLRLDLPIGWAVQQKPILRRIEVDELW
jgi:hypothetical protein